MRMWVLVALYLAIGVGWSWWLMTHPKTEMEPGPYRADAALYWMLAVLLVPIWPMAPVMWGLGGWFKWFDKPRKNWPRS